MKGFYAAIMSGAVGVGCLAALATMETPKADWTGCEVVRSYEDNSHLIFCGDEEHHEEPDFKPDFWEQLDIIRELEGAEYA